MTNILLSFRHTKYSKIKVTVRPEQKRHLICPEIAWSVRIEHIVWFTWTDHAFTPNRWSVLFEAIACFPLLPFTLKHPWIKGCEGGMQIFILLLHYTLLTSDRKESRFATNIEKLAHIRITFKEIVQSVWELKEYVALFQILPIVVFDHFWGS